MLPLTYRSQREIVTTGGELMIGLRSDRPSALPPKCAGRRPKPKERGILKNGVNDSLMRLVTHYDVSREACEKTARALQEVATGSGHNRA
jgi:hypothetical protein